MKEGFMIFLDTPHNTYDFTEIDGVFFKDRGETFDEINNRLKGFVEFIKENGLMPITYEIKNLKTEEKKLYTISESIRSEYEEFEQIMLKLSPNYIFENSFKIEVYKALYNYHESTGKLKKSLFHLYEIFLKSEGFSLSSHEKIEEFLDEFQ
ncbi:MAG: hypothetical protein ACRC5S_02940 [Cetobacterium sp.]